MNSTGLGDGARKLVMTKRSSLGGVVMPTGHSVTDWCGSCGIVDGSSMVLDANTVKRYSVDVKDCSVDDKGCSGDVKGCSVDVKGLQCGRYDCRVP
eukprot:5311606-Pyramimonas_sp.AAC.1